MSKYVVVFPATRNYLHEARPLLRSLAKNMPNVDVHILTTDLTLDDFKDIRTDGVTVYQLPEYTEFKDKPNYEFRRIRTSRFYYVSQLKDYDSVCVLDADMVVIRDVSVFFGMAESGNSILVGSNNTLLRYVHKDFVPFGLDVSEDINVVHPTFCTVPMFINPLNAVNNAYLLNIWNNITGNDLDTNNLVAEQMGIMSKFYLISSYIFTGIHHTFLKPETFIKDTGNGLYSHQGEPVYALHGHLGSDSYLAELMEPIRKNYGYYPPYLHCAENCIALLKKTYADYKDK